MARTVQQMLDRVYETLQDMRRVRYPVAQLIGYLNDAVIEARSIRPDLFVGVYDDAIVDVPVPVALGAPIPFPLPDQFFPAVCYYVTGRAEMRDDEFAVDGRAATLLSTFGKKLVTGV